MKRRVAWTPDDYADMSIFGLGIEYRAGTIDHAAFAAARGKWLAASTRWSEKGGAFGAATARVWWLAYATASTTRDDAEEALRALAVMSLPAPDRRTPDIDDDIGRIYLRAGHAEEALPFLRHGARSCRVLLFPMFTTIANADLGEALERIGDLEAACDAYGEVVRRWGQATPRSITLERAVRRRITLRCKR